MEASNVIQLFPPDEMDHRIRIEGEVYDFLREIKFEADLELNDYARRVQEAAQRWKRG